MKKILSVLLIIITVFCLSASLTACKKEKTIIGSWEFGENGLSYTFEEDGRGYFLLGQQKNEFTYTIYSNELTILYDVNTTTYQFTYEIQNDNTLLLTDKTGATTEYNRK